MAVLFLSLPLHQIQNPCSLTTLSDIYYITVDQFRSLSFCRHTIINLGWRCSFLYLHRFWVARKCQGQHTSWFPVTFDDEMATVEPVILLFVISCQYSSYSIQTEGDEEMLKKQKKNGSSSFNATMNTIQQRLSTIPIF